MLMITFVGSCIYFNFLISGEPNVQRRHNNSSRKPRVHTKANPIASHSVVSLHFEMFTDAESYLAKTSISG
jgi:hypothetical protein